MQTVVAAKNQKPRADDDELLNGVLAKNKWKHEYLKIWKMCSIASAHFWFTIEFYRKYNIYAKLWNYFKCEFNVLCKCIVYLEMFPIMFELKRLLLLISFRMIVSHYLFFRCICISRNGIGHRRFYYIEPYTVHILWCFINIYWQIFENRYIHVH